MCGPMLEAVEPPCPGRHVAFDFLSPKLPGTFFRLCNFFSEPTQPSWLTCTASVTFQISSLLQFEKRKRNKTLSCTNYLQWFRFYALSSRSWGRGLGQQSARRAEGRQGTCSVVGSWRPGGVWLGKVCTGGGL